MLEHARRLLWAQLVRITTDLDDLRVTDTQGAELASKLGRLNAELGGVFTISKKLWKAASEGPIIIMTAGQNTLIVWGTGPVCVPLPDTAVSNVSLMALKFEDLAKDAGLVPRNNRESLEDRFAVLLSDLWDRVVYPIKQQLIPHMPRGFRLWWCPTVSRSQLLQLDAKIPKGLTTSSTSSGTASRLRYPSSASRGGGIDDYNFRVVERIQLDAFACPAVHDPIRPFQSAFEMRDGSLMMYDVARIRPTWDSEVSSARFGPLIRSYATGCVLLLREHAKRWAFHQINAATTLNEAPKAIDETAPLSQRIAFVHVGV
ncbi:hypothetical protein EDD16DRAFT_1764730 [Pisolithus croceorrhizus]|nr:hypothetical protein EDD16DRAFT_1764730 [Pisolithus croceorrhizus]KAI6151453.1 hypothetical protein EDD17DRAFT_1513443 [Pisolithus thermaeus]